MSTGLKQELGLGEPNTPGSSPQDSSPRDSSPEGSTEQADQFRAAFQAAKAKVDGFLQYTAAHAEQAKHDPQANKRDTTCSAYQVALSRIDPTNPAAAQGAIDQVLAAVNGLGTAVDTFKQAVERAFNAWTNREPELDGLTDKIREMVEWGHDKASALQQIVEAIASKANCRKYEEALQALEQLLGKIAAIYEEFLRQKAAQEEYDTGLAALETGLAEASTCEFAALEAKQQEITTAADQMRQAAEGKDYVSALEQLRCLEGLVADYLAELEGLRAAKEEYEAARAELDPRLTEAPTSQYQSLVELDQQIDDLTGRMDEAAAAEEYQRAVEIVNELSTLVDEKLNRVAELEAAKEEYETNRAVLEPRLTEASTSQYEALAELDQQIADLTGRMDEAATAGEYEQAVEIVNELSTKVDEKIERVTALEAAKEEYEAARAALDPRLAEASESIYPSLAQLQEELATIQGQMEIAAQTEDYEQALQLVNDLTTKVDTYLAAKQELEDQYQQLSQDAQTAVGELQGHSQKAHFTAEIAALETQFNQAKSQGDSNQLQAAIDLLRQVLSACSEIKTTMDLVATGLDRARAEEVADVSQSLIDTGVDRAKALEVGQVMQTGGSGTAEDSKLVAAQVAELPLDVIQDLNANGTSVVACRDNVTDHISELSGVQPRGWDEGDTWDMVPGLFDPNANEVVIATTGHGTPEGAHVPETGEGHGSYDLVTHEAMHGHDHNGGGTPHHDDPAFVEARQQDAGNLNDYLSQAGEAGLEETYAESAARYYDGDPTLQTELPHLYEYWRNREAGDGP